MKKLDLKMNYDKEANVLYVTLGTGEPSYCEETNDDTFLIERGLLTGQITGFRYILPDNTKIRSMKVEKIK